MQVTAGMPFLNGKNANNVLSSSNGDSLFELFKNPAVSSKPFVRWWWNGDKLSAKEILRELDVMKAAGIGGVEINPIAFPGGDDLGIPSLQWLSPEWIEMVKVALQGAAERGMICDTIVGSGWPFGAEFLTREEQTQLLTLSGRKVSGPGVIQVNTTDLLNDSSPKVNKYKDALEEIYALYLAPVSMDSFQAPVKLPFAGEKTVSIHVPAGEHILYSLVKVTGFQAVINGAPGAAGPVLNHYNQEAVEKFLNRMSDNLFPAIKDLKPFRAMFCDSMELEGANWCQDFPAEFKRRRGYELDPYLPFILFRVGGMGTPIDSGDITQLSGTAAEEIARVRYDFIVTCMDVMHDRFLVPYTQWCNKHGFKSRVQTYGREFHPLEASMEIDIPECETWLWAGDNFAKRDFAQNPTYTNVNKFVASAAHYSNKKIVSCEEVTNTSVAFNATLERIKVTGDQSNLSGVNHSILHGFNYTPLEAPFPGWIRYGTFFNERNPWWPFFKLWSAYKARVSTIFQETEAFADIAVMHPLADMWTTYGTVRDPFPEKHFPEYQYKIWESIHKNGNSCDYTSEGIIQKSVAENGFLRYNKRKYHTLILIEVETMMPATATAIANFVKKGGKLIFIEKEPYKSPGLTKNYKANDKKVAQTIASIKKNYPARVFKVPTPTDDVIGWFKGIQQQCGIRPYMQIDRPTTYVSQIRHQANGKDIFFVSNCSTDERFTLKASFPESKGAPSLWDAETGERYRYPGAQGNTLSIDLPPASSQLIVFEEQAGIADYPVLPSEKQTGAELKGWLLRMEHVNGTTKEKSVSSLFDLSADESTQSFAGYLYYEKKIVGETSSNWLDLGKVFGVSEVTVNGEKLGCHWYGRHLYRLPEHIAKAGEKNIQVKITTTLGNYFKSNPENKTGNRWTNGQAWQSVGLIGPVRLV
jgi:hypothetical protein